MMTDKQIYEDAWNDKPEEDADVPLVDAVEKAKDAAEGEGPVVDEEVSTGEQPAAEVDEEEDDEDEYVKTHRELDEEDAKA